jgi:hypothetical protein
VIPTFSRIQAPNDILNRIQQNLSKTINPMVNLPQTQVLILKSVVLASGTNYVQHKLGHTLTGWRIIRQRSAASIYDQQDQNLSPAITLALVSSAAVTCDIEVF